MKEDVFVSVTGIQTIDESDDNEVVIISKGKYYKKDDKIYIRYEDTDEKNITIYNTIKIMSDRLEIRRVKNGDSNQTLIFQLNKSCMSNYKTIMGNWVITTNTKEYEIEEEEGRMEIHLGYSLEINHSYVTDCNVVIKVADNMENA